VLFFFSPRAAFPPPWPLSPFFRGAAFQAPRPQVSPPFFSHPSAKCLPVKVSLCVFFFFVALGPVLPLFFFLLSSASRPIQFLFPPTHGGCWAPSSDSIRSRKFSGRFFFFPPSLLFYSVPPVFFPFSAARSGVWVQALFRSLSVMPPTTN